MNDNGLESAFADELLSVCRTRVGDGLRSITYFTESQVEQVYLRSDLEQTADLLGFAELERSGFRADKLYRNTQLGEYQATVRMFEYGYLTRIVYDRCGVWVTTDSMSMDRFEELAAALKPVLAEQTSETIEESVPFRRDKATEQATTRESVVYQITKQFKENEDVIY